MHFFQETVNIGLLETGREVTDEAGCHRGYQPDGLIVALQTEIDDGLHEFHTETACLDVGCCQVIVETGDAELVVTDSFHACVFAIIFGKPYIAVGNKERGMARFASLEEAKRNLEAWRQSSLEFLRLKIDH